VKPLPHPGSALCQRGTFLRVSEDGDVSGVCRVSTLLDYGQCFPGVVDDDRRAWMVVVPCNRIDRIVGVGPHPVDTLDGTVALAL